MPRRRHLRVALRNCERVVVRDLTACESISNKIVMHLAGTRLRGPLEIEHEDRVHIIVDAQRYTCHIDDLVDCSAPIDVTR